MITRFKDFILLHKNRVFLYGVLILIAMFGTWYTFTYAINFSALPITLIYLLIYMAFYEIFDTYILTEIDTLKEVKHGNIAVAIFILAIAVIMLGVAVLVG